MKSLLIIATLAGLISFDTQAQTKRTGSTHKKTVHKKKVASRTVRSAGTDGRIVMWQNLLACASRKEAAKPAAPAKAAPTEPCYSYRKNNIIVTECPGVAAIPVELSTQGSYMGYYQAGTIATVNPTIAPQHNTINNAKGSVPHGGNFCGPDCSSR
ncbi:MAG: hypothetical protein V4649_06980 [Bacteroidota bacterium]